ncbi:nuclease A inhibitor family protein [Niabella beijingensis]|uniref:nuclease A inhibitor family protein n=1 Tax=Niabella beijingensis TaxID=2872700 RepID=UPI001CBD811A|nr:nuclease A inhibitor family protein [Niabella beijingensis]MBZ4189610.1 nuclease A inhibitor family protein [Niabella beijingensis]
MNTSEFLTQLQEHTRGVVFISESEYPFEIQQLDALSPDSIVAKVAELSGAQSTQVKAHTAEQFFSKVQRTADPADAPVVANAQKIKALYDFLNARLTQLQVYRVEAGVQVPIYILGLLPDQTVAGIKTTSIES